MAKELEGAQREKWRQQFVLSPWLNLTPETNEVFLKYNFFTSNTKIVFKRKTFLDVLSHVFPP